jgi:hypothetical protein
MVSPVPVYAQEAYAVLRSRFGEGEFGPEYLAWFVSETMVKKMLHVLEKAGWTRRVGRGRYVCVTPDAIFQSMVRFRVPQLLEAAGRPYVYAGASAVEIWTDYSYIQRSFEHSPYFVKVLRRDVRFWVSYFRAHKVRVFVGEAGTALGEFIVLQPQPRMTRQTRAGLPVEPVAAVVRFCERNIDAFEYPLAYLNAKFGVKTRAALDPRIVEEAAKAL